MHHGVGTCMCKWRHADVLDLTFGMTVAIVKIETFIPQKPGPSASVDTESSSRGLMI